MMANTGDADLDGGQGIVQRDCGSMVVVVFDKDVTEVYRSPDNSTSLGERYIRRVVEQGRQAEMFS